MSEFIGTKLTMNLGERSYDIIVKSGSLENLYQFARLDRRVAVVTDSGVPAQYAQMVADQCKDAHIITVLHTCPVTVTTLLHLVTILVMAHILQYKHVIQSGIESFQ